MLYQFIFSPGVYVKFLHHYYHLVAFYILAILKYVVILWF